MNEYLGVYKCEWSSNLPISHTDVIIDEGRTQSIGSPAGFMIVALNGLWVCRNCLVIVDNNVRSSSAKLDISSYLHPRGMRGKIGRTMRLDDLLECRLHIGLLVRTIHQPSPLYLT